MTQTPQALLKKLKPTPSFPVTDQCVASLAKFAIDVGPDGFVREWMEANRKTARAKKPKKAQSPDAAYSSKSLTSFYKAKKMRSSEAAEAIVGYALEAEDRLEEPSPGTLKGVAAALKWLNKELGDQPTRELVERFLSEYA